jgi:TPR repeat protein
MSTLSACAAGSTASAIRPADPTYADAVGAPECRPVDDFAEPLAVDWQPDKRADLEVAMHAGIAVVAYDCTAIRLLPACRVEGSYGFIGTTRKEQIIRLDKADELGVNLPFSGAALKGKLAADMQRGATLDVALMMVGKRVATHGQASVVDLVGDCSGATHIVHSATVGAFAMATGTKAHVETAVELFGAGGHGSSDSAKDVSSKDGSLDDCRKATPDDTSPQGQCSAIVRLQLRRIGSAVPNARNGGLAHDPCPTGLVLSEGKCTTPAVEAPHLCAYGDASDCKAQCDRGDPGSCANLALMYDVGTGVKTDTLRASQLFETACEVGNAPACGRLGEMFLAGSGPAVDEGRAREFLQRGCADGWMPACTRLGELERKANAGVNVLAQFDRACRGGDGNGCANLGYTVAQGWGTPADPVKAATLYTVGCTEGSQRSCTLLGEAYEKAQGVAGDDVHAATLYKQACDADYADGCSRLSMFAFAGRGGLAKSDARGIELIERACKLGERGVCLVLAMRLSTGLGVAKDPARAVELLRTTCAAGEPMACKLLSSPAAPTP